MANLRELGHSGLHLAPLVLGGNVFGWTADEKTSFAVLDAFVAGGGNAIDTADVYSAWVPGHAGGGQSETVLGKWLAQRGRRDDVLIFTKVGMDLGDGKNGLAKARIKQAVEASLQRLQTDYIDLYQSHKDDESLPVTEPLEAYAELLKEGKIRAIGASNFQPARLQAALDAAQHGLPRYESLQPEYNLYAHETFEHDDLPIVQASGIGVIPYFGLASGFLTGKYRSAADLKKSQRGDGIGKKYLNDKGFAILKALDAVAGRHAATPAQVALAWLMQAPGITAPIASGTSPGQITELTEAMELRLTADDVAALQAGQPAAV
ncbi:aldo/keto reductase [Hymenobacter caeli]|uniref:Aryl-alcohol dehydrogenase-like predicted oxidoreductase n=1 Tax=Hymenobacter caeli TaxID=2735894 RepID=A0ABX2FU85_9BACT|nr:aldo/keto reductase [Hymenobacter caeli]NRT19982.1 aryl-alcohol dehydrogenase-like predicted oxidoreductase [Hymenobacter caeli]